ncbi:A/G-specific adenine glycosylase [Flavobacterium sp. I3-2]|uniref:A/G-specific adenine glycosylase n=1 Tax=Flavobacterium sp. I3-2 TaxID=2748319 RepID=UPI0015AA9514|nr:A/G-specific adenine glycosylase [Flavobacterium sp. I3-2]
MSFSKNLIDWYLNNKRDLPWRNTTNPYHIWLSEIILQQTRVNQGLPYFNAFVLKFPTVNDLADATEDDVLKLWQGLGYYSRARNLHATAKFINANLNGIFPKQYKELIKLKGIGPYTAAAIASFAYKEQVAVVDGNVFRVISRYFGIYDDISTAKTRTVFQDLSNDLITEVAPDLYNQAIMDFGAIQCTPKNPVCLNCIFQESCYAFRNKKTDELPIKLSKTKVSNRFFNFLIYKDKSDYTRIEQRTEKDIWQNLYQFPLIETSENTTLEVMKSLIYDSYTTVSKINTTEIIHKLSHQKLHINYWEIEVEEILNENKILVEDLNTFAFPIVLSNFIKMHYEI